MTMTTMHISAVPLSRRRILSNNLIELTDFSFSISISICFVCFDGFGMICFGHVEAGEN